MDDRLKLVAQAGDINLLYTLIGADPCLLDNLDKIPFVETPLHVAASLGHTLFAAEIMRLKPSFAEKPNEQGHTPLQVALHNNTSTVHRLIAINPGLVCIKGREGMTPLHFAAQNGDIELLNSFLSACPLSIMETTIRNETALHIAVKNRMFDAFDVLIGRLRRALHKGSLDQQVKILRMKDDDGNTVLHIAAKTNQPQVIKIILNFRPTVKIINEKNLEGLTALDIWVLQLPAEKEINKMLLRAGALRGTSIPDRNHRVNSKMSFFERKTIDTIRHKTDMSESSLNILVVIMVLIATVTYQSALSPPGGLWQDSTSSNTTKDGLAHKIGTSIMASSWFIIFCFLNFITLVAAILTILFLLPKDLGSRILYTPLYLFVYCFAFSISIISPTRIISAPASHLALLFLVSYILAPWSSAVVFRKLPVFMIDQS